MRVTLVLAAAWLLGSVHGCMKCCEEPLADGTCCCITPGCPILPLSPSCPPSKQQAEASREEALTAIQQAEADKEKAASPTAPRVADPAPVPGPYNVTQHIYSSSSMDRTDRRIYVYAPDASSQASIKFPLIAFAHGFGLLHTKTGVVLQYDQLLSSLASFGFIVIAPVACPYFCLDDRLSLSGDPPFYGNYYTNQLKAIDWARELASTDDPVFRALDLTAGAGIAGHSMGGQATLFSSSGHNATKHDIRAAVMLHAFTHSFATPTVPYLVFTGDKDKTAPPEKMAAPIFNSTRALSRGYVNRKGAIHDEPDSRAYNPLLPQFVASFFKLFLGNASSEFGLDFDEMIFGNGTDSLCGGGDGLLVQCETHKVRARKGYNK